MIELIPNRTENFTSLKSLKNFFKMEESDRKSKLVEFKDWEMTEEGFAIKNKAYQMRESGMKSILSLFGMPINFYFGKAPTDMLIKDINRMRDEYTSDSEVLVHLKNDEVRAITKPGVKVISNRKILRTIPSLKNSFSNAVYSDYGLRITTKNKDNAIKVSKNDVVGVGIDFTHSDTGMKQTSGFPYLLRLVCTNGLVLREKSHLVNSFRMSLASQITADEFLSRLSTNISSIETNTKLLKKVFKKMKDIQVSSLQDGKFIVSKLRSAIGRKVFDDHEKLTIKVLEDDKEKKIPNIDMPVYSLLNIATRLAKKYDYLQKQRIESIAGALVTSTFDMIRR